MHNLDMVFKSNDEKIVRTPEQIAKGEEIAKTIHALLQANLRELGAAICEGKPYEKGNGKMVTPYSVQGTINMPPLTFDDGSGDAQTYKWVLNFRASIPVEGEAAPAETKVPVQRAMTIAEARKRAAEAHK